jgi:hypothetical protein
MTIDDLLSSPHYIIVYVPQDLFKLSNMFPDPTILDQLLISTIGQEQDEVRIYHISPDDLAIPSHTTKVQDEEAIYLESITPASYKQDYGSFRFGTGTGENPITIAGTSYDHGLTTHANGTYLYHLQGKHSSFYSVIGVDSANGCDQSSVIFEVLVDQIQVYKSPVLTVSSLPLEITIDVTGKNFLQLVVNDAGDGITCDHASWGNAILYTSKT